MNPLAKRSEKASDVMQCETEYQAMWDLTPGSCRCLFLKLSQSTPYGDALADTSYWVCSIPPVTPPHWGPPVRSNALHWLP
ncbi:hypothetical protein FNV43_RR05727 [Rhamnella rubrinervis]|uniref:Uncharacterized protein n=1 Tax=Rhamnella rubrinervis TaxID=2594499 RepID=A0A8K0HPK6_9ROSA|nr:hypothetical protein FNV43_RR05727 [Rhamnella rubrinervis]